MIILLFIQRVPTFVFVSTTDAVQRALCIFFLPLFKHPLLGYARLRHRPFIGLFLLAGLIILAQSMRS